MRIMKFRSSLFELIDNKAELSKHESFLPFFQKARKDGYDGKGVTSIQSVSDFKKRI